MSELKEGHELYFVPSNKYRNAETVTVLKVGRKWASLSNRMRIDLSDMRADGAGYSSPGKAWSSKEEYDAAEALRTAWQDFRNDIYRLQRAPDGVTISVIDGIRKAIGLEVLWSL